MHNTTCGKPSVRLNQKKTVCRSICTRHYRAGWGFSIYRWCFRNQTSILVKTPETQHLPITAPSRCSGKREGEPLKGKPEETLNTVLVITRGSVSTACEARQLRASAWPQEGLLISIRPWKNWKASWILWSKMFFNDVDMPISTAVMRHWYMIIWFLIRRINDSPSFFHCTLDLTSPQMRPVCTSL